MEGWCRFLLLLLPLLTSMMSQSNSLPQDDSHNDKQKVIVRTVFIPMMKNAMKSNKKSNKIATDYLLNIDPDSGYSFISKAPSEVASSLEKFSVLSKSEDSSQNYNLPQVLEELVQNINQGRNLKKRQEEPRPIYPGSSDPVGNRGVIFDEIPPENQRMQHSPTIPMYSASTTQSTHGTSLQTSHEHQSNVHLNSQHAFSDNSSPVASVEKFGHQQNPFGLQMSQLKLQATQHSPSYNGNPSQMSIDDHSSFTPSQTEHLHQNSNFQPLQNFRAQRPHQPNNIPNSNFASAMSSYSPQQSDSLSNSHQNSGTFLPMGVPSPLQNIDSLYNRGPENNIHNSPQQAMQSTSYNPGHSLQGSQHLPRQFSQSSQNSQTDQINYRPLNDQQLSQSSQNVNNPNFNNQYYDAASPASGFANQNPFSANHPTFSNIPSSYPSQKLPFSQHPGQHHSTSLQHPGQHPSTSLQDPGQHPSTSLQHPGQHPSTSLQHPGQHPSTSLQHPGQHPSTSLQHPGQHPSTSLQHPGQHHSTSVQHNGQQLNIQPPTSSGHQTHVSDQNQPQYSNPHQHTSINAFTNQSPTSNNQQLINHPQSPSASIPHSFAPHQYSSTNQLGLFNSHQHSSLGQPGNSFQPMPANSLQNYHHLSNQPAHQTTTTNQHVSFNDQHQPVSAQQPGFQKQQQSITSDHRPSYNHQTPLFHPPAYSPEMSRQAFHHSPRF